MLNQALNAQTPEAELVFSFSQSERAHSSLRTLIGKSGLLRIEQITFHATSGDTPVEESYLLAAGRTDAGEALDAEQINHLLDLATIEIQPTNTVDGTEFTAALDAQAEALQTEVEARTTDFFFDQTGALNSKLDDHEAAHMAARRVLEKKRKKAVAAQQKATTPAERVRHLKDARRYAKKIAEGDDAYAAERNRLMQQTDDYLELLEASLGADDAITPLFTVRWQLQP